MKKYLILFSCCLFFFSCSQNKNNSAAGNTGDTATASVKTKDTSFFPVTSFLQKEIQDLDSLPVTILEVTTVNNKQDSAWLPAAKVKPKLQPFLSDVIDKNNLSAYFKETNFNDQSTEAITLMYDPKAALPDSFALRRWDVYINPDKNTLRRVYMVKRAKENNAVTIQQLTWQSGKWAKIVTINNENGNNSPVIKEIKWVWDLRE
jgi:hypothetical protein